MNQGANTQEASRQRRTRLVARSQLLTEKLEPWLLADLAKPVKFKKYGGVRYLTIMRGIYATVSDGGRVIQAHVRVGGMSTYWKEGPLRVDQHLLGDGWAIAWWWTVRLRLPRKTRNLGDTFRIEELASLVNQIAIRSDRLHRARQKIIKQLDLDPVAFGLARHLSTEYDLDSAQYCYVRQNQHMAQARHHEAPKLWPLYDLLRKHEVTPECDLGQIKRKLRKGSLSGGLKLTRGGWRTLCHHGHRLWWPLRHCHEYLRDPLREVTWLANLVAASGRSELPPRALLLALGRVSSMHLDRDLPSGRSQVLPLLQAAWQHLEKLDQLGRRLLIISGILDEVLSWWLTLANDARRPAGADWNWFVSRMRRVPGEDSIADSPWLHIGRVRAIGDMRVVPLCTLKEVRRAGRALRNCMAQARASDDECGVPHYLICDNAGNALALFSALMTLGEPPRITEIRARFNQPAEALLQDLAESYLQQEQAYIRKSAKSRIRNRLLANDGESGSIVGAASPESSVRQLLAQTGCVQQEDPVKDERDRQVRQTPKGGVQQRLDEIFKGCQVTKASKDISTCILGSVIIKADNNHDVRSVTFSRRTYYRVCAGAVVTIRGQGFYSKGELMQDYWRFNMDENGVAIKGAIYVYVENDEDALSDKDLFYGRLDGDDVWGVQVVPGISQSDLPSVYPLHDILADDGQFGRHL